MRVRSCAVWVFLFLAVPMSGLPAQDVARPPEDAAAAAGEASTAGPPGPEARKFDELLLRWKDLLAELGILRAKYRDADTQQRAEIERKWEELIAKGDAMEPQLLAAAEKAYLEAPNQDKRVSELLVGAVAGHVGASRRQIQTDNYEEAMRLAKLLLDHQCADKQLYSSAGLAAFALDDFDTAEKYLKQAAQDGTITPTGEAQLARIADCQKAWAEEQQLRQAEAKADDLPRVLLKTSQGDLQVELFENEAPNTVANFVSLVEKGYYDGLSFHRVLPGFMAQGGCPDGSGAGGPGYNIFCECYRANHRNHFRGSLSMAHAGKDTGGSQFFITFLATPHLNGKHTVFGRVTGGLDVLHKLQRRDPARPNPPEPDKILEAKVLRKRDHEYKPKTIPER